MSIWRLTFPSSCSRPHRQRLYRYHPYASSACHLRYSSASRLILSLHRMLFHYRILPSTSSAQRCGRLSRLRWSFFALRTFLFGQQTLSPTNHPIRTISACKKLGPSSSHYFPTRKYLAEVPLVRQHLPIRHHHILHPCHPPKEQFSFLLSPSNSPLPLSFCRPFPHCRRADHPGRQAQYRWRTSSSSLENRSHRMRGLLRPWLVDGGVRGCWTRKGGKLRD